MAREKFKTLTEQMFYILLCLCEECRGMDILEMVRMAGSPSAPAPYMICWNCL